MNSLIEVTEQRGTTDLPGRVFDRLDSRPASNSQSEEYLREDVGSAMPRTELPDEYRLFFHSSVNKYALYVSASIDRMELNQLTVLSATLNSPRRLAYVPKSNAVVHALAMIGLMYMDAIVEESKRHAADVASQKSEPCD